MTPPERTASLPARRPAPRWHAALAAALVTLASWAGASEIARPTRSADAPPVNQALRALARLMRGRADGEQLRAASRRRRAPNAGRLPSELRQRPAHAAASRLRAT